MCTLPEDAAVVASTIASPPRPAVPAAVAAAAVLQLSRRKRRHESETPVTSSTPATSSSSTAMVDSDQPLSADGDASAESTLLRRLLAGAELASVRNQSNLVDGNFMLRRTSSMSTGSSQVRSTNLNADPSIEDIRPRRSTMFSQLTLPRRCSPSDSPDREGDDEHPPKRAKDSTELVSSGSSSPPVPIKVESKSPNEAANNTQNSDNTAPSSNPASASTSKAPESTLLNFPMKPSQRWRLKSPTRHPPSHSLSPPALPTTPQVDFNEMSPMRPRARTASELDRVISMFTQRMCAQNKRVQDLCLPLGASRSMDPLTGGRAGRTPRCDPKSGDGMEKPSDMTSPLSQLLESTPPYSGAATTNIHTRANTINSVYRWSAPSTASRINSTTTTPSVAAPTRLSLPFLPGNTSLRIISKSNPSKPPDLQIQELSNNPVSSAQAAADTVASFFAATSGLNPAHFLSGIRDQQQQQQQQVLDYSQKDLPKPPLPLSLATDDILQWSSSASQAVALQQLFGIQEPSASATASNARPLAPPDDRQAAKFPVRLSSSNPLLLCRRVAEWMLVANAWTMQLCPADVVPPNALLATAATYRFCRCSEAEQQSAPPIKPTLESPNVSPALRAVLHRIWPQLLLASMIRENFSFSTVPIPTADLAILLGRDAAVNGSGTTPSGEINIAKMGTANALRSLIEAGNPLLLDTQVLECVRKCIFAQHAYPAYYPVPYATAIDELRRCCHRCSGDASLFNNVVLLMNEMQSISPEGLHCLFSIDKLAGLFATT